MLYAVEVRREREQLTALMAQLRQWLDANRFEPDAFRCTTDDDSVTCRIEFKIEAEARACAETFAGQIIELGDQTVRR